MLCFSLVNFVVEVKFDGLKIDAIDYDFQLFFELFVGADGVGKSSFVFG